MFVFYSNFDFFLSLTIFITPDWSFRLDWLEVKVIDLNFTSWNLAPFDRRDLTLFTIQELMTSQRKSSPKFYFISNRMSRRSKFEDEIQYFHFLSLFLSIAEIHQNWCLMNFNSKSIVRISQHSIVWFLLLFVMQKTSLTLVVIEIHKMSSIFGCDDIDIVMVKPFTRKKQLRFFLYIKMLSNFMSEIIFKTLFFDINWMLHLRCVLNLSFSYINTNIRFNRFLSACHIGH